MFIWAVTATIIAVGTTTGLVVLGIRSKRFRALVVAISDILDRLAVVEKQLKAFGQDKHEG